jgi:uncharacterized protein (DUF1015 family)
MEIKPFKAYRFNPAKVGDVGRCIAPPFDVIGKAEQERLYKKSKYNVVRITKGKETAGDDEKNNMYTRAGECLSLWLREGVLKQDQSEGIYGYVQDFRAGGRELQRLSFIAMAKLEEFGKTVRPHEGTVEKYKTDRLKLRRVTHASFGLPYLLYQDKGATADRIIEKAARQAPLIDFVDEQGVRHRLFAITAREDINEIVEMMRDKDCIIADGHHRYETGLRYSKENADPAAKYLMIAFVNTCQKGLVILATYRAVYGIENFSAEELPGQLKENFEITEYLFDDAAAKGQAKEKMISKMKTCYDEGKNVFGFYCGDKAFRVAVLKDSRAMESATPGKSPAWRSLDVSVLQKLVLEKLLGIDEGKLASGSNIEYINDVGDAIDRAIGKVDSGEKQVVFFLNPVKMQQLTEVTAAGEKMPQKSTYFYPKVYTGLTINKM